MGNFDEVMAGARKLFDAAAELPQPKGGSPIRLYEIEGNYHPRKMTKRVYSAMDDGLLSADAVALMCLRYMSEADVAEMLRINEISDI